MSVESPLGVAMAGLMTTSPKAFALALSAYNSGNLAEGERLCRKIVAADRNSFEAHHLLGVVQAALGKKEKALASYDRAVSLRPRDAAAFSNRGVVLKDLKRFDEALASLDRALALDPRFAEAHTNRGNVLRALGRYDEALASYSQALAIRPNYAQALRNRGVALYHLERFDDALASFDSAIALKPDLAEAYADRGLVLRAMKRFEQALANYDRAIALAPGVADLHDQRANVLLKLKRFEPALASADRAIAVNPELAEAHANRGLILHAMRRYEEALTSCGRAIRLKPDFADAYFIRGHALHELKRLEEAIANYEKAIQIDPRHANANGFLSHSLLLLGQFERGWKSYEWRKKLDEPIARRSYAQPAWSGEQPIAGATLFIHSEQGLGDTLQFCRYAKRARALGARVILSVPNRLVRLLQSLDPAIEVIADDRPPDGFDYHCALLSLPLAFKTTAADIPAETPYLHAEPSRVKEWKRRIGDAGLKIGVCWQGNTIGADISFSLKDFHAIAKHQGVRLISLQKGDGRDQLNSASGDMRVESFGDELDSGNDAFLDTAAIMESLDLIITTDTSIAHLAGALGRPVWVALKFVPDWRWGLDGDFTPWYSSMRLFRQKSLDNWKPVFAEIESAIAGDVSKKS